MQIDPRDNKRYSELRLSFVSSARVTRIDGQQFTEYARNVLTRWKV